MKTAEAALRVAASLRFGARAPAILAHLGLAPARIDVEAWRPILVADAPEGIDAIHPSWTGRMPPAARAGADVRRWLRRALWGMLVSMPATGLAAKDPAELIRALEALGRSRLALALRAAPTAAAIELAGKLGEHGQALLTEVNESTMPAKGAVRSAVQELSDILADPSKGDDLLFLAGVRHAAPLLIEIGGDLGQQLAQRLPKVRGELLLHEMARAEAAGFRPSPNPTVPRTRLERLL